MRSEVPKYRSASITRTRRLQKKSLTYRRSGWQEHCFSRRPGVCRPKIARVIVSEVFSKLNYLFFGYFDLFRYFLIIKINSFWGDLSGISATTATLVIVDPTYRSMGYRNTMVWRKTSIFLSSGQGIGGFRESCSVRVYLRPGRYHIFWEVWAEGVAISVAVLAEIPLKSPQKIFIFIIKKIILLGQSIQK